MGKREIELVSFFVPEEFLRDFCPSGQTLKLVNKFPSHIFQMPSNWCFYVTDCHALFLRVGLCFLSPSHSPQAELLILLNSKLSL